MVLATRITRQGHGKTVEGENLFVQNLLSHNAERVGKCSRMRNFASNKIRKALRSQNVQHLLPKNLRHQTKGTFLQTVLFVIDYIEVGEKP